MNFIHPEYLWALLVLLALTIALTIYGNAKRRKALNAYLQGGARLVFSPARRTLRHWLLCFAILFCGLAAARPWWGEKPVEVSSVGSDVLVVFDVSKSMLAEDLAPSRLEHAKWLLRELIRQNPEARFGIIAFAGRAVFTCPLTADRVTLEQCIEELQPDLVPMGGTNLAAALQTAEKALNAAAGESRTILLFTDGEELYGSVAKEIASLKKAHVELLIAGFGDPNAPALIPEPDGQGGKHLKRDAQGELVRTRLNEPLLQNLARETGGLYLTSGTVNTGLEMLNQKIRALSSTSEQRRQRTLPIDRFMLFLVPGALAFALYLGLGEVPSKRKFPKGVGLILIGIFLSQRAAAEEIANVQAEPSALLAPAAEFNLARENQLAGKTAEAVQGYERVLQAPDAQAALPSSLHNLGVITHTAGRTALTQSRQTAQTGSVEQALQGVAEAEKSLNQAEEYYQHALGAGTEQTGAATALQLLLQDRETLEKLKKELEELQKKQQETQQKIQQAQKQNQEQQKQGKQEQNQQNQQSQGQQGQNQQNQQQNSAQKARQEAQQAVNELQKQADAMKQQETQTKAQKAADALQKAAEKQAKQDFQGAGKDLERAARELGSSQPQQSEKKQESGDPKQPTPTPEKAENGNDKLPQSGEKPEAKDKDKGEQSADALLDLMREDEKILRNQHSPNRRIKPVDKDW